MVASTLRQKKLDPRIEKLLQLIIEAQRAHKREVNAPEVPARQAHPEVRQ
jgi:hypothetical protein